MTKQTSESGKAKKISRDEELDCYFGPGLSISFPPSTLMNVSSVLPPRFNYSPRTLRPPPQHSTERAQQAVKTVLESLERCPIFFWKNAVANYCTSKRFCSECNHSSFGQQLAKKNTLSQFKILYMAKKAEQNETWRQCLQRNSSSAFINCCDLIARTERGKLALDG